MERESQKQLRKRMRKYRGGIFVWNAPEKETIDSIDILFEVLGEGISRGKQPFVLVVDASHTESLDRNIQARIKRNFTRLERLPTKVIIITKRNRIIRNIAKIMLHSVFPSSSIDLLDDRVKAITLARQALGEAKPTQQSLASELAPQSTFQYTTGGVLFGLCFPIIAIFLKAVSEGTTYWQVVTTFDPVLSIVYTAPFFLGLFAYFIGLKANAKTREQVDHLSQMLLDGTSEGVCGLDLSGNILFVNARATKLLGFSQGALIGRSLHDLVHSYRDDGSPFPLEECPIVTALQFGHENSLKKTHFYRAGKVPFPVEYNCSLIKKQGTTMGGILTFSDVSEKVLVERILTATSEIHAALVHHTDLRKLYDFVLNTFLSVTKSEYGFMGEIKRKPDGTPFLKTLAITNISWNKETSDFYEANAPTGLEFFNLETLFGWTIKHGKAVITNHPDQDPRKGGLPEGHPPLNAFMGLPIVYKKEMIAMFGVANRLQGYNSELAQKLTPMIDATADVLVLTTAKMDSIQETKKAA